MLPRSSIGAAACVGTRQTRWLSVRFSCFVVQEVPAGFRTNSCQKGRYALMSAFRSQAFDRLRPIMGWEAKIRRDVFPLRKQCDPAGPVYIIRPCFQRRPN